MEQVKIKIHREDKEGWSKPVIVIPQTGANGFQSASNKE